MSSNHNTTDKNNIIKFPDLNKNENKKKSENIKNTHTKQYSTKGESNNLLKFSSADKNNIVLNTLSETDNKQKPTPIKQNHSLEILSHNTEQKNTVKSQSQNRYITASVACALCIMLFGFPFFTTMKQTKRGIASSDDKVLTQEKNLLHLLNTGQRTIANVGKNPSIKDMFLINFLQSNYEVQWENHQLLYAVLRYNHKPIRIMSGDKMIKKYNALFPKYIHIKKIDSLSDTVEVYELQDADGILQAKIELFKNIDNKLLSIHVQ